MELFWQLLTQLAPLTGLCTAYYFLIYEPRNENFYHPIKRAPFFNNITTNLTILEASNRLVPLWPACTGTIAGILMQRYAEEALWAILISIFISIVWCAVNIKTKCKCKTTKTTSITTFFLFLGGISTYITDKNHWRIVTKTVLAKAIVGTVVDVEVRKNRFSTKLTVSVDALEYDKQAVERENIASNYTVTVFTPHKYITTGSRIKILNSTIITSPKISPFFSKNSWQMPFIKDHIVGNIFHIGNCLIRRLDESSNTITTQILMLREKIKNKIMRGLSPDTFNMFASIFLGYKSIGHDAEIRKYCSYWGLSHFLARSGLHIMLYGSIWIWVLSIFPLGIRIRYLLLLIFVGVYAILSWVSISFIRACALFVFLSIGRILMRSVQIPHLISLLALEILLTNPYQLFALDFQLSFALAFSLSLAMRLRAIGLLE